MITFPRGEALSDAVELSPDAAGAEAPELDVPPQPAAEMSIAVANRIANILFIVLLPLFCQDV